MNCSKLKKDWPWKIQQCSEEDWWNIDMSKPHSYSFLGCQSNCQQWTQTSWRCVDLISIPDVYVFLFFCEWLKKLISRSVPVELAEPGEPLEPEGEKESQEEVVVSSQCHMSSSFCMSCISLRIFSFSFATRRRNWQLDYNLLRSALLPRAPDHRSRKKMNRSRAELVIFF